MTSKALTLSTDQEKALQKILAWWGECGHKREGGLLRLAGYAGTGKTTLLSEFIHRLHAEERPANVAFCAYTGKASNVLRQKLDLREADFCGTIHSLIYRPVLNDKGALKSWRRVQDMENDLIVIDEASMVSENIYRDISKFKTPILAVGDHGQLPPVQGSFNLMADPDIRLETIHRQAEDNPIIRVAQIARSTGKVLAGIYGDSVRKIESPYLYRSLDETFDPKALYLCAYNSTRTYVNKFFREKLGIKSPIPIKGEKLICLRNNNEAGIYNGQTGILRSIEPGDKAVFKVTIDMDGGDRFEGEVSRFQFGQKDTPKDWNVHTMGNLFDWGYCLTVHKAQGSEADKVILIEQRSGDMEDMLFAKWLYTAITRAKRELLIIHQTR